MNINMRAKCVNENVNFERGQDPKGAMGIGDENIRKFNGKQAMIKNNYRELDPFINHEDPENLDLRAINDKINSLIDSAQVTIIDYFNNKYNLELTPVFHDWRSTENLFAKSNKNGNEWFFYSNSSGAGIFIGFSDGRNMHTSNQGYKMKTIEEKFLKIVKKFNVQL